MTKTDRNNYGIAFKDKGDIIRQLDLEPMSLPAAQRHREKLEAMKPGIQFFTINTKEGI